MPTPGGAPATASPTPTASPRELKTITTVVSSPYCSSLATHFNNALVPMVANDRTLDGVSVQLDDFNTLFSEPDYVERFLHVRDELGKEVDALYGSLTAIQQQINQLRDGEHLTTDATAASQIHQTAEQLQRAYDKQRQLAIDLAGMHQAMIDYNIDRANVPLGGFSLHDMTLPAEMKDVKSYLRFQGQRDVIADAEGKAVDIAYQIVTQHCSSTPSPTPSPK